MHNVYSAEKILRFPQALEALRAGRPAAPIHVRLKPTNACTHACRYCCYRNRRLPTGAEMDPRDRIPTAKLHELIEDFASMGVRAVTLSGGGDPLCHPAIGEVLRHLSRTPIAFALLSNGSLLSAPIAALLARAAAWVRISLDAADPALYARIHGVAESEFSRVCEHIAGLTHRRARRCAVGLNMVVSSANSHAVLDVLRLARRLSVDHIKLSAAVVARSAAANEAAIKPFRARVAEQVAEARRTLESDVFRIVDKIPREAGDDGGFRKPYRWCPSARVVTVIGADQRIYACQDKAYAPNGRLGSIRSRRFRDVWAAAATRRRLRAIDPHTLCRHHCASHPRNRAIFDYLETSHNHVEFV